MITVFLKLNIKRFYQILSEIGFLRALFLLGAGFGALYVLVRLVTFEHSPLIPTIVIFSAVISVHFARKDKRFLKLVGLRYYFLFIIEYLIITAPVLVSLVVSDYYLHAVSLVVGVLIIAFTNITVGIVRFKALQLNVFPLSAYEWKSGVRSQIFLIIVVSVLAIVFSKFLISSIGVIIVIGFVSTIFFHFCEPSIILYALAGNSKQFLSKKLVVALKVYTILVAPHILLSLVFHLHNWYFTLTAFVLAFNLIILAIVLKYALYQPGGSFKNNSIILSFMLVCYFFPFLMPVPFIFTLVYYRKAIKNLNTYFYAYN